MRNLVYAGLALMAASAAAADVAEEMLKTLRTHDYAEWIRSDGRVGGARKFLMGLAMPLAAIEAILKDRPLVEIF